MFIIKLLLFPGVCIVYRFIQVIMLSRGKLLIKIALGRQDCRTFATKKSPSLYALLNYLDNEAKRKYCLHSNFAIDLWICYCICV